MVAGLELLIAFRGLRLADLVKKIGKGILRAFEALHIRMSTMRLNERGGGRLSGMRSKAAKEPPELDLMARS